MLKRFAGYRALGVLIFFATTLVVPFESFAEEICAEVKIEILQEFSIERQAFEARMRITNQLDTFALENVRVDVDFSDQDGIPVLATSDQTNLDAKFFISVSELTNINNVTGSGTIQKASSAEIKWLIVPALAAADGQVNGKLYYVGARLSYTYGGKEQTITVTPDTIVVKPQPEIQLDYFLTRNVVGDNPFTSEVESPVPYTLGVRVRNGGMGVAKNVRIDSAQPKIVQNEQSLAIGFKILESYVGNLPAQKTLLLNFGDIDASSTAVGRWVLETSLSGTFVSLNASTTHADELGGQLTSLIQDTREHFLEHNVLVQLPGRDQIRDFLVRISNDESFVYESELTGLSVNDDFQCIDCIKVSNVNNASLSSDLQTLSIPSALVSGFVHIRIEGGSSFKGKQISSVIRSDGSKILSENAWISQEYDPSNPANPRYFLNIFDYHNVPVQSESYRVVYGSVSDSPQAPVIQYVSERVTYESSQVGFLIKASDADSPKLVLSATGLPAGAKFNDQGDKTGVFTWFPIAGQAGTYTVSFKASDGKLEDIKAVSIKVNPLFDTDGDGLPDEWEMQYFGNLDQASSDNPDNDLLTNLEEYEQNTDPNSGTETLASPEIISPIYDAEISSKTPALVINNITHDLADVVQYEFEVFSDESYLDLVYTVVVDEQSDSNGKTQIGFPQELTDNQHYFWRVKAKSALVSSLWQEGKFFVNTANDAPSGLTIAYPSNGSLISTLAPKFYVNNANDLDEDAISYSFELYRIDNDNSNEFLLYFAQGVSGGVGGTTSWSPLQPIDNQLIEDQRYKLKVQAKDEHGLESVLVESVFIVSSKNSVPSIPVALFPASNSTYTSSEVFLNSTVSSDSEGDQIYYYFEIDRNSSFEGSLKKISPAIEGDNPRWLVTGLVDNTTYYWRVRASDGPGFSDWSTAQFLVDIINTAPTTPVAANPEGDVWIDTVSPSLQVAPAIDKDGDSIQYMFELYQESMGNSAIATFTTSLNQWKLSALSDNEWYSWRVKAIDSQNNQSEWSSLNRFFINLNGVNDPPTFQFVSPSSETVVSEGIYEIQWLDTDPDSSAKITLMYGNGQIIASQLDEDADGEGDKYFWDVSGLSPGVYKLSALIEDEQGAVNVDACCNLIIPEQADYVLFDVPENAQIEETGVQKVVVGVRLGRTLQIGEQAVLNFTISDSSEAKIENGVNYLAFDSQNWNQIQYIEVTGVDDCDIDGDQQVFLQFLPIVSNNADYDGQVLESVEITSSDNESIGQTLMICEYDVVSTTFDSSTDEYIVNYRPKILNLGGSIKGAAAVVTIVGDSQVLESGGLEGTIHFPAVLSGQRISATDTFVVRRNISKAEDFSKFTWNIAVDAVFQGNLGATSEADSIDGDEADNYIEGLGGDDLLNGMDGNDILYGGPGSDQLYGGNGDDAFLIYGNDFGVDYFDGGSGFDQIVGGYFDDVVRMEYFQPANSVEAINLGAGSNRIEGTLYADTLDFSSTSLIGVSLIDGLDGDDFISGSQGSDTIRGGAGADELYGNGGDDVFLFEGISESIDSFFGGEGNDTLLGSSLDDAIIVESFGASNAIEIINGAAGKNNIYGTSDANYIDFSNTSLVNIDQIDSGDGDDTVKGDGGSNRIIGGAGNDLLYGNDGDDVFVVIGQNQGVDQIYGGDGFDSIVGSVGDDIFGLEIHANNNPFDYATVERIDGGGGYNQIAGNEAANFLDFRGVELIGINRIDGKGGDDTIYGNDDANEIVGGTGNDMLDGEGGDDVFLADSASGVDRFIGGSGNDGIVLTDVDDVLTLTYFYNAYVVEYIDGSTGVNVIEGTDGIDTLKFSGTQLLNIDHLDAKGGNDLLYGSEDADVIYCSAGNDVLYGEGGDDLFLCNPAIDGIDRFYGGDGYDTIRLTSGDDVLAMGYFYGSGTVNEIDGNGGYDIIVGTENSLDTLDFSGTKLVNISAIYGLAGDDNITGSADADVIVGGAGNDFMDGDAGDDTFLLEPSDNGSDKYYGGAGTDTILGTTGDDVIGIYYYYGNYRVEVVNGNGGFDVIVGSEAADSLYFDTTQLIGIAEIRGMGGNDTIKGSAAADTLVGGLGDDTIYGMTGADNFIFNAGDGRDRLYETGSDYDQLMIHGVGKSDIWFFQSGSALFVYFLNSTDRVEIYSWYSSASYKVERIVLDSGDYIEVSGIESLAVEMTPYGNPDTVGFTVPSEAQSTIDAAIESAWQ